MRKCRFYGIRAAQLRHHKYGITPEDFSAMLGKQMGCCKTCGDSLSLTVRNFAVDPDHVTNQVHGILCRNCNIAIGLIKDSASVARRIADYLIFNGSPCPEKDLL